MAKRPIFFGWWFTSKSIIAVCHVTSLQISYFGLVTTKQYSHLQNLQSQEIGWHNRRSERTILITTYKKIHETSFSTRRQRAKNITLDSRGHGMTMC